MAYEAPVYDDSRAIDMQYLKCRDRKSGIYTIDYDAFKYDVDLRGAGNIPRNFEILDRRVWDFRKLWYKTQTVTNSGRTVWQFVARNSSGKLPPLEVWVRV